MGEVITTAFTKKALIKTHFKIRGTRASSQELPDVDVSQLVLNKPEETLTVHVGIVDVAPKTTSGCERRPVTSAGEEREI